MIPPSFRSLLLVGRAALAATFAGVCLIAAAQAQTPATPDLKVVATVAPDVAATRGALYPSNQAPLTPSPFVKLPVGSITPKGWLKHQLELERDGMMGHLEEISGWLNFEKNPWTDPQGRGANGWEEFPYWIKGYGDLGYVLGDEKVIANAKRWLKAAMATQREDGYFGPRELLTGFDKKWPDMWPQMPVLNAMQNYYEFSGDKQVIDVMTKYFHWQDSLAPESFDKGYWPRVRMSDNIESIHWLYNRTGDKFLLGLADKIYHNSMRWNGIENWHNVNIAESFRTPTVYGEQVGSPELLAGAEKNYQQVMGTYGQFPGGGFAGDENCRPGHTDPRQGFETCGMVEFMHSFEMLTKMTGRPVWADRCEEIAFNSLPAAMTPDQKALHYLTGANMVQLDSKNKSPGLQNSGTMISYSPFEVYRCCQHNHGMGWPYFAEELWLGTPDGGLCASLYAANTVKAKVGANGGKEITIEEATDYPFSDKITLKVVDAPEGGVAFPLYVRVPGWCRNPSVTGDGFGGGAVTVDRDAAHYLQISGKTWKKGDQITLTLPMELKTKTWAKNKDAVSVSRGPLTFSLSIAQKSQPYGNRKAGWPETEVYAASPWNYGLALDSSKPLETQFEVTQKSGPLADQPFTPESSVVTLKAKARKIDNWQLDNKGLLSPLQASPAKTSQPVEVVSLIPMGAARLRVTAFPTVSDAASAHEWTAPPRPAAGIKATASFTHESDSTDALSDGELPKSSADGSIPRFTWWDRKGTTEWVQYDFDTPRKVASASVYWFDDTGHGQCRVPQSWKVLYKSGDTWKPVQTGPDAYGVKRDTMNRATFAPVETSALRLEVQLQPDVSGGILEWKVE